MKLLLSLLPLSVAGLLLGLLSDRSELAGAEAISAESLRADVEFLAADERGGRWLGERGLEEAESFIANAFERAGLDPLPGEESFFVDFTLWGRSYDVEATRLELLERRPDGTLEPRVRGRLGVDFRPFDFSATGQVEGEVVFAGYGITAPDLEWDDYEGLDVEGKVVLVLRHQPRENDPSGPFGLAASDHALFATKAANAEAHGASGMILVTDPLHHPAQDDLRLQAGLSLEPHRARIGRGNLPSRLPSLIAVHASQPQAAALAKATGSDLLELQRAVDAGIKPTSLRLEGLVARIGVELEPFAQEVPGRNVVALLEGSDPSLAKEWIVVGGHHDHIGSFAGEGDTIYNGADDNASGTAGVLALARAFATADPPPKRSLVFATFSAEERGLLGSRALVDSGRLPMDRVRFMVNLDMIGRNGDQPVQVLGDGYGLGLAELVEEVNREHDVAIRLAGRRYASNSDHDPFFDRGIPFLFFFTGLHSDYHQLSDHADKLDYRHMESLVRLTHGVLHRLANGDHLPPFIHHVAWLGAGFVDDAQAARLVSVERGSRASELGLQVGDRLLPPSPRAVEQSERRGVELLAAARPGVNLSLRLERPGETSAITLRRPSSGYLGVTVTGLGEQRRQELELVPGEGILIRQVVDGGPAALAGVRAGDILLRLAGRRIGMGNLHHVLGELGAGARIDLTVARNDERRVLPLTLGRKP